MMNDAGFFVFTMRREFMGEGPKRILPGRR